MAHSKVVKPAPVCIAGVEIAGGNAPICEGKDSRALETESLDICVAHAVIVDLV